MKPHDFFPDESHWTLGSCFKLTQMVWNNSDFHNGSQGATNRVSHSISWLLIFPVKQRYTPCHLTNHPATRVLDSREKASHSIISTGPSSFSSCLNRMAISVGWFLTPLGGIVCGGGSALGDWHAGRPLAEKKGEWVKCVIRLTRRTVE